MQRTPYESYGKAINYFFYNMPILYNGSAKSCT